MIGTNGIIGAKKELLTGKHWVNYWMLEAVNVEFIERIYKPF